MCSARPQGAQVRGVLFVRTLRGWATENAAGRHFQRPSIAEVAELADALDSGSSALTGVRVQIPASAPTIDNSYRNRVSP